MTNSLKGREASPYFPKPEHDPATHFLLLCLRARFEPQSLAEAERYQEQEHIAWDLLERRIVQERLGSLIYAIVREQNLFPPQVEKRLHQSFIQRATVIAYLNHELEQVVACLSEAGIDLIVLKGAALAKTVYPPDYPRYFTDLDILVSRYDVNPTIDVLMEMDYGSQSDIQLKAEDTLPYVNEWQLRKQGHLDSEIDIHWHLSGWSYYQHHISLDWFWQTAVPVPFGDYMAKVLGPEAQIIHLCIHFFQHLGQTRGTSLRLLHDIAEVINYYQDALDWQELLDKTAAFNIVIPVSQALLRVWEDWRVPIPPAVVVRMQQLPPTAEEQRAFALLRSLESGSDARFAAVSLANLPSWRARLRYIFGNLLFPPAAYMRHRYNVQRQYLLPLYYPYRWYLGLISAFGK